MNRTRWAIIGFLLLALCWGLGSLYLWNTQHRPYPRTQQWTPDQKKEIKKIMREKGPLYTLVSIEGGGIYVDTDRGKSWIARGE